MSRFPAEFEELRVTIERLRAMLESLIVRGLRACGSDEIAQLQSYIDYLDKAGASHIAGVLTELREQIEKDDRVSARTLLSAQTSVRLLERMLTLRVVNGQYAVALAGSDHDAE
jgi:hypothetical protein